MAAIRRANELGDEVPKYTEFFNTNRTTVPWRKTCHEARDLRYEKTRRERLKSAPYLRLKKLKLFEIVKGGPFGFFENPICCGV